MAYRLHIQQIDAAGGNRAQPNKSRFFRRKRNVFRFAGRRAERDKAVVLHINALGHAAVFGNICIDLFFYFARKRNSRIGIRNKNRIFSQQYNFVGLHSPPQVFREGFGTGKAVYIARMRVRYKTHAFIAEAQRMH